MANFLSGVLGNKGIAKLAGEKAGDVVEDTVNKVLGGKEKEGKGAGGSNKGFDVSDVLDFGGKKEDEGGLDVGDALSFIGDSKDKGDGGNKGFDLSGAIGDFMK
ncbi:hypothetical protein NQD34_011526 [Periophthalmus magnuspinnatus]|nr:hypothetical protein NQD34_011526 [Periophthalmus magnuspinnatus]